MKESSDNQGFRPQTTSKFELVIVVTKRSKQIIREAKKRGMSPNQVALVESKYIKPTTLALEEFKAGKLLCSENGDKKELPSEEMASQSESEEVASQLEEEN